MKEKPEENQNKGLTFLLKYYDDIFREDLPDDLTPDLDVDHVLDTVPNASTLYQPLYQLSPAKRVTTRQYISDLLKKNNQAKQVRLRGAAVFC